MQQALQTVTNELFQNQQQLKEGLNSAEFNLRAHQKVFNSIALDLVETDPSVQHLDLVEMQVGDTKENRINWALYHHRVEEELKLMAAIEKDNDRKRRLAQVEMLEKMLPSFRENIDKQVAAVSSDLERAKQSEAAKLFFKNAATEMQNIKDDKPYDEHRFDNVVRVISAVKNEEVRVVDQVAPPEDNVTVFGG